MCCSSYIYIYTTHKILYNIYLSLNVKQQPFYTHLVVVFVEIIRCHLGGFGRSLQEIRPASVPELPIQLRHLRNNQIFLKTYV